MPVQAVSNPRLIIMQRAGYPRIIGRSNYPLKLIQHFHEEVYAFQVGEFVVVGVDARAEEEAGVATVDDFRGAPELDEVGLVFLVPRGDEPVDFAFEFDFFVVRVGVVPFG